MTCSHSIQRTFTAGLAVSLLAALFLVQPVVARASIAPPLPPDTEDRERRSRTTEAAAESGPAAASLELAAWQFQMHERVKQHQLGWIVPAALFDGGGRAVWWSMSSTDGPWILAIILGVQTIEGAGILASQSTLKLIHRQIDQERSALHLSRRLARNGWTWFAVSMGSLALGWIFYGLHTVTWDFGLIIAAVASWLVVFPFLHPAITNFAVATDARRVANGHTYTGTQRPRNRKPRPEVVAASPLGFVLVW